MTQSIMFRFKVQSSSPYTSPPSSDVSTEELKSLVGSSDNRRGLWEVWAGQRGSGGFVGRLGEGPAIDSGLLFRINRQFLTRMRPLCVLMK